MNVRVKNVVTCGHDASKDLGVHAVGRAPTEGLKLRRQMAAAAAGKKSTTSLSFLVYGSIWLGSRGGTFYFGHSVLGRRSLDGKMVQLTKRSVDEANSRGSIMEAGKSPAGAVMCETRDLVCKVWHTLMFDGEIEVDMSAQKMFRKILLQRARTAYWK